MSGLSDEEFVPFLHYLGVDTDKKSFEWLLNEQRFARVLRWLFKNLDHNNAWTASERQRYHEIKKSGSLLSPDKLESSIAAIQEYYPGICLPGDHDSKEDVKLVMGMQKKRLSALQMQKLVVIDTIMQNEIRNEDLTIELAELTFTYNQCLDDEIRKAEECTTLALELETIMDEVIGVTAENVNRFSSCKVYDVKDSAHRFFVDAPLGLYARSQALFQRHFHVMVCNILQGPQNDITDEEFQATLLWIEDMEDELVDAAYYYIDTEADLSEEQAKLMYLNSYNDDTDDTVDTDDTDDTKDPVDILLDLCETEDIKEFRELELKLQMERAIAHFAKSWTIEVFDTVAAEIVAVRQPLLSSLTHLVDLLQEALSLDQLVYECFQHEFRIAKELRQFTLDLSEYMQDKDQEVDERFDLMTKTCAQQNECEQDLPDDLPKTLFAVLHATENCTYNLEKLYNELQVKVKQIKDSVDKELMRKEKDVVKMSSSSKPLRDHIWDGCTKPPNCRNKKIVGLKHTLSKKMTAVERSVEAASSKLTHKKSGKHIRRKLWQWFLTNPTRLHVAIKYARTRLRLHTFF